MTHIRKTAEKKDWVRPDIEVMVDGRPIYGIAGQSLLSIMWASGIRVWRVNPVSGRERSGFCGMGVCFECDIDVQGSDERRACMILVTTGVTVTTGMSTRETDVRSL